jgi:hypothetical protein
MIYDLRPGELVETSEGKFLDEDQVEKARAKLEKGTKLETVARQLGASVWESPAEAEPVVHVAVSYGELVDAVGEDKARELMGAA